MTGAEREVPSTDATGSLRQSVDALLHAWRGEPARDRRGGGHERALAAAPARAGESFQSLLDQARCRAAIALLAERERKVIDVSIALR